MIKSMRAMATKLILVESEEPELSYKQKILLCCFSSCRIWHFHVTELCGVIFEMHDGKMLNSNFELI